MVIDVPRASSLMRARAPEWQVVHARYAALGPDLIARVRPDCILMPLFGPGYDALAVLERMATLDYAGSFAVLTARLPAPEVVRAELRAAAGARPLYLLLFDPVRRV